MPYEGVQRKHLTASSEREPPSFLEKQYEHDHTLHLLSGDTLEYVTVVPEKGESAPWCVMVGGFATTKHTFKEDILDLARAGQKVLFVIPDKGDRPNPTEQEYFAEHEGIPKTIQDKAAAIARLLEHEGIEHANLVGHSQGAAVLAACAALYPWRVNRLLLDNPAGMSGPHAFSTLLWRFARGVRRERNLTNERRAALPSEDLRQEDELWAADREKVLRHPLWRVTREAPELAKVDLVPVLRDIQERKALGEAGPEVILLNAQNDQMFTSAEVEQTVMPEAFKIVDRWVMYADKEAGHGKLRRPEAGMASSMIAPEERATIVRELIEPPERLAA